MNSQKISELINIKQEINQLEEKIQDLFIDFSKKKEVDRFELTDYCERRFQMIVFFDLINIESIEKNLDQLKKIILEYKILRTKQAGLEKDISIDNFLKEQIKNQMKIL